MLDSIIAERYAKALFELALENGRLEQVKNDMDLMLDVVRTSKDFKQLLISPVIRPDKKVAVMDALFEGKIDNISQQFYRLIANKRREKHLAGIAEEFIAKYKEHNNIVTVEIRTVDPLSDKLRDRIVSIIEKRSGVKVELIEIIDKDMIGGFVVSTANRRYDASLTTTIKKLRKEFEENLYIREF